ncbi:MAG: GNAT family N-acetyltransferase [bacterium]|nr:GNAT family N-acetyltransferase [bacterium]
MELGILKKEEVRNYFDQTNLVAYSEAFGKFALSAYESQQSFIGINKGEDLKAFFPVFERVCRNQKTAEVPLFIYTDIFFVDKNFNLGAKKLGEQLLKFLKADVLRFNLYHLNSSDRSNLNYDGLDHIFTAMVADLGRAQNYEEYLAKVLSKNARSKIYKACQSGLELTWLTSEDLTVFHQLYSAHVRMLGSRPHSLEYFQKMLAAYTPGRDLFMMGAKKNGRLITANLFVINKDYMEVRFLADDLDLRHLFPNNFLYAKMIQWAYGQGIRCIDFGGIPKEMRSNIEFKMSLGAEEWPIYTKYFFRNSWQKLWFKVGRKWLYWKKYRQQKFIKFIRFVKL